MIDIHIHALPRGGFQIPPPPIELVHGHAVVYHCL